ncbi:MAG: hypothetical protein AAF679_00920 [Pseudomonadota bacterium]
MVISDEKLIKDWLDHMSNLNPNLDEYPEESVWIYLDRIISKKPEQGWNIIRKLARAARTDEERADVSAGPLEDLLKWHEGPPRFLCDDLEVFKMLIPYMWIHGMSYEKQRFILQLCKETGSGLPGSK